MPAASTRISRLTYPSQRQLGDLLHLLAVGDAAACFLSEAQQVGAVVAQPRPDAGELKGFGLIDCAAPAAKQARGALSRGSCPNVSKPNTDKDRRAVSPPHAYVCFRA